MGTRTLTCWICTAADMYMICMQLQSDHSIFYSSRPSGHVRLPQWLLTLCMSTMIIHQDSFEILGKLTNITATL